MNSELFASMVDSLIPIVGGLFGGILGLVRVVRRRRNWLDWAMLILGPIVMISGGIRLLFAFIGHS